MATRADIATAELALAVAIADMRRDVRIAFAETNLVDARLALARAQAALERARAQ